MSLRTYPGRLLASALVSSFLLLTTCGIVAWYLHRQQTSTADALSEDIGSRGAAINLEATLHTLIALQTRRFEDVETLHLQVAEDLKEIERFADKPFERQRFNELDASFKEYLLLLAKSTSPTGRAEYLQSHTLPAAQALRQANGQELKISEEEHRRSVRRMAWGLFLVGALGSIGGVVFGFGLARSLRRAVQQFLIRVQGASDLLSQQVPSVEIEPGGEPLRDGTESLVSRVEQAVQKLNEQEREVRRAERLAVVGQLAAGVAHEVRNPLTSAILLLQTARKDPSAGGLTEEDLYLIEEELLRIEQSLKTFLLFSRPPKLERREIDLAAIVRETLVVARGRISQASVKVDLRAPDASYPLTGDQGQLGQVVLNLIFNAIEAMPMGGQITINLKKDPRSGFIELSLSDRGLGIDALILPRLFEPFITGKETGTGLGLGICKRIVEEHGGTIRGFNLPEGGACFILRLPSQNPALSPASS